MTEDPRPDPDHPDEIRASPEDGEYILPPGLVVNFYGTQYPTAGQQREMMRQLRDELGDDGC